MPPADHSTPPTLSPAIGFPLPPLEYDFLAPPRIVFGWGRRREIGTLAASLGRRAFVVTGSRTLEKNGTLDELLRLLEAAGVEPLHVASISHEPEVGDVDRLTAALVEQHASAGDFVIGLGGGSAIDLAKAAAAIATNRDSTTVTDYLEGVGRGLKIVQPPLPLLAVPTTAGTGSEATKNAVISSYNPPFKKSLRSDLMLPRIVLIDPELTTSAPATVTAHTGMDAITQLIESYISRRAKPLPRALCVQGIQLALPALPEAVRNGSCRWAREAMSQAALLSGMALANSGLGLAHGLAAALGAECHVSHGLACAVMLPVALKANRDVAEKELAALARAAGLYATKESSFGNQSAAVYAFVQHMESLVTELGIPTRLRDLQVRREQIPALVAGSHGNSLAGNPREISDDELTLILETMW
ncbi:MAG TPA: iron-containing alcohol dehydrogenase [Pirellulales bacterium]|jgi:alcohol dehydrogenase class IV|nr:iron-containing alcohol dehydrogenase [Pirellulales bacterium]